MIFNRRQCNSKYDDQIKKHQHTSARLWLELRLFDFSVPNIGHDISKSTKKGSKSKAERIAAFQLYCMQFNPGEIVGAWVSTGK